MSQGNTEKTAIDSSNPIRRRRLKLGMKADYVARKSGFSRVTLHSLECGKTPHRRYWNRLAFALNWTVDELVKALVQIGNKNVEKGE